MPMLDGNITLAFAKQWLRDRIEKGTRCPCCNQMAKIYQRRINAGMAYGLCLFFRAHGATDAYVHVPSQTELSRLGGDWAKLALWGLVEERPSDDPGLGPHGGWWRLTKLGARFVAGQCRVPAFVYVYDGAVMSRSKDKTVSIHEALGAKFSWKELMRGVKLPVPLGPGALAARPFRIGETMKAIPHTASVGDLIKINHDRQVRRARELVGVAGPFAVAGRDWIDCALDLLVALKSGRGEKDAALPRVLADSESVTVNSALLMCQTPSVVWIHLDTAQKWPSINGTSSCTDGDAQQGVSLGVRGKDKRGDTEVSVFGLPSDTWRLLASAGRYRVELVFVRFPQVTRCDPVDILESPGAVRQVGEGA